MNKEEKLKFSINDIVVYHPFKTNSFYDAKVIDVKEGDDKPYLLYLHDAENLWAYPIEVQSIEETYPSGKQMEGNKLEGWSEAFEKYAKEGEDDKLLTDYIDSETIQVLYNEEKELNLAKLLKGCEGERFYLLSRGYATLKEIIYDEESCNYSIVLTGKGRIELYATGKEINNEAIVILYPSKELYKEYPLEPYSAWMVWKKTRKIGYELAIDFTIEHTEDGIMSQEYDDVSYVFRSEQHAQQAIKVVKEALRKFYEKE